MITFNKILQESNSMITFNKILQESNSRDRRLDSLMRNIARKPFQYYNTINVKDNAYYDLYSFYGKTKYALKEYCKWIEYCLYTHRFKEVIRQVYLPEYADGHSYQMPAFIKVADTSEIFGYVVHLRFQICIDIHNPEFKGIDFNMGRVHKNNPEIIEKLQQSVVDNWNTLTLPLLRDFFLKSLTFDLDDNV